MEKKSLMFLYSAFLMPVAMGKATGLKENEARHTLTDILHMFSLLESGYWSVMRKTVWTETQIRGENPSLPHISRDIVNTVSHATKALSNSFLGFVENLALISTVTLKNVGKFLQNSKL